MVRVDHDGSPTEGTGVPRIGTLRMSDGDTGMEASHGDMGMIDLCHFIRRAKNDQVLHVDKVARAVLSDAPQFSEGKEIKLEELIDSLGSNPFLTRNQIPLTPENLINEIRSSWRKAIEMEENSSTEPIQMDTEHREVLPESSSVLHDQREFSMADFLFETTVSDFGQSHSTEEKDVSDSKCVPQKHVVTSHIEEPLTQTQSDLLNKKVICKQDLECIA
ncbi:HAUS augmin-like complex subunit 6 [Saguinus oedipus]|uniref:HAUS augmin-like complex subunit 6 n=1 Tax=Saguinus oedipus TaxID=9490 RepID=A0ABQ9WEJ5_SAGOE|nr:HAUS augmin-like complex subunit 6 [Saguinus oedipus]